MKNRTNINGRVKRSGLSNYTLHGLLNFMVLCTRLRKIIQNLRLAGTRLLR